MTPETIFAEQGVPSNPFPGLRPFDFEESHLFFGRDGQSEQLISKLGAAHFLAAVGTSGSGKSSLIRAGLMPALLGGFMMSAGSNWRIAVMRPGNDPIGNLARALNAPEVFGSEIPENVSLQIALTEASLQRGSRGLVDAVRQSMLAGNESLLVVVDQFEEIFRFARVSETKEYHDEAAAFVKLLLEAANQREVPIYVVLTMRSDYLGDCSKFWGLPEAINESQYLIPRLTRDQLKEAITGPISVAHGDITPRLIARLLNDVGDNQDQLPVLQHLLMRMWDEWKEKALTVEVTEDDKTSTVPHRKVHAVEALDLCCYEAVGGMANALSRHADEALKELAAARSQVVAEKLFKALTEKGSDNREIRRPVTLGVLCALAEAQQSEVSGVIDTFRRPGRSFLMTPAGPLGPESLIDISHESLIRAWTRLKEWVEEESRSARIYRRLAETAVLESEGGASLWRDPDLQIALTWRNESKPNQAWAQRYHPEFERAMDFLNRSVAERDAAVRDKELQRKRAIKRTRVTAIIFGALFLVALVALYFANQQRVYANEQRKKADDLLIDVRRNSAAAQEAALQKTLAVQQAVLSEAETAQSNILRMEAEMEKEKAREQQKEAEAQKRIAIEQTEKVKELELRARQEAHVAQEINTLIRQIDDDLKAKKVDDVINNAKILVAHFQEKADTRGEFETQTILANAYLESGDNTKAQTAAEKALTIRENSDIENSRLQHENLEVLIEAYLKQAGGYANQRQPGDQSDLKEALRNALLALRIQEGSFGLTSQSLIPDLGTLASIYEKLNQPQTSRLFRERIVEVQKEAARAGDVEHATALIELAKFEQNLGTYTRATERLNEALAIQQTLFGDTDERLIPTLSSLAKVYRLDKSDAKADLVVQRLQRLQGKDAILRKGASGSEVGSLQQRLQKLGYFKGAVDQYFGVTTEAAVIEFQKSKGVLADGSVGPSTIELLSQPNTTTPTRSSFTGKVTVDVVKQMFPSARLDDIQANLPGILRALEEAGLTDKDMVLMALTTVGLETGGTFAPMSELKSRFNTSPNGHAFDLYDTREDLGNKAPPDGERFRGRGYIQITGRRRYIEFGIAIGLEGRLENYPELANDPNIAAKILVQMLKKGEGRIREPLAQGDLAQVNKRFFARSAGPLLEQFKKAFQTGASLIQ